MIKGGYKIVNFNGVALSGTAVTLSGIYDQIVDDYDKPIMVSGVSLNGDIMDDAYAGVQEKVAGDLSKSVELTVYGGIITVTEDDEVSFVLSKTTAELTAEIGDLDGLETTEKDSLVDAVNELADDTGYLTLETGVRYRKFGNEVAIHLNGENTTSIESSSWIKIGTLPEGLRPSTSIYNVIALSPTVDKFGILRVSDNGELNIFQNTGSTLSNLRGEIIFRV